MLTNLKFLFYCLLPLGLLPSGFAFGDIPLIGSNIPHKSLLDGDFDTVMSGWRAHRQSPHWKAQPVKGKQRFGLAAGRISSGGNPIASYESPVLHHNRAYSEVTAGDVYAWRFAANAEYPCDGRVSFSLVFGDTERVLADKVIVPQGPDEPRVFEGLYTVSAEDAERDLPLARFTLQSNHNINVYVDYVDLKVLRSETAGPSHPTAKAVENGIELSWNSDRIDPACNVYRSNNARRGFVQIAESVSGNSWTDTTIVNGQTHYYAITVAGAKESSASEVVEARKVDSEPPAAPTAVTAIGGQSTITVSWKLDDDDIASYNLFRRDGDSNNFTLIRSGIKGQSYEVLLPVKGQENTYAVQAVDFSGNVGPKSEIASARVTAVLGASFSDLILPMSLPKSGSLRDDLWGLQSVLPRDPENGIEHPDWSYWGGRPRKDSDGKYHMLVVRWPEGSRKGHWNWVNSTVVHAVSDKPAGPYKPTAEIAYDYAGGKGHNADVMRLNDGRYLLYSLIDWKPMLLVSNAMRGPWKMLGEMNIHYDAEALNDPRQYQSRANLSGLQLDDGSMLFVTKFGRMMKSENGLTGPYEVLTDVVQNNNTIPEQYRKSNYEDPVMWRDDIQFHQIINAFLDYRAIYLRSPDGIHWIYDTGLAYTPQSTCYADGTRNRWDKLERPHVLQDEFGRATHLSVAAIDIEKGLDFGNDNHNSKNLIMPLVVPKRITMLNEDRVNEQTPEIRILVHSEPGFDAQQDLDIQSLRFGASEEVNFGRGSKVLRSQPRDGGLELVFDGTDNGLTKKNFACKLIGRTTGGDLSVGFSKLQADGRTN